MPDYGMLLLTVQKEGKFGEVWVLRGLLRHLVRESLVYYEDTASLVDELKGMPEGVRVRALHVLAPGFAEFRSAAADRSVTQDQYLAEVLV